MNDPIDYSRPVGWWCTCCLDQYEHPEFELSACEHYLFDERHKRFFIPRYLPLPTPESVEVDEVETGEAEVVTFSNPLQQCRLATVDVCITDKGWIEDGEHWCDASCPDDVRYSIEAIATASANARKKRGMK
jgi:hypothetical protein